MKKFLLSLLAACISLSTFAQKDPFVGFYEGKMTGSKKYTVGDNSDLYAEIYRGPDGYRMKLLPAVLARGNEMLLFDKLPVTGGDELRLDGVGDMKLKGVITHDKIELSGEYGGEVKFDFTRMNIVSPTMGAKAPAGAIVLFDGTDTSHWVLGNGEPINWDIQDGAMTVKKAFGPNGKKLDSTIFTKEAYSVVMVHVEFKINADYGKLGQDRGNSGFRFGPYEIQVLDSFGVQGFWNDCGAVYRIWAPKVNACLEPEVWQTYDIEFHAAKYDGEKLVDYPRVTVYHNGILVQDNVPIYHGTSFAPKSERARNFKHPESTKISLHDHNDPVAFRNIWIRKL